MCSFLELVVLILGMYLGLFRIETERQKCLFMSFKNVLVGKDIKEIPYIVYGALWFSERYFVCVCVCLMVAL